MMNNRNHWLLPEGIEEILPPHAARLEALCRDMIDLYTGWGYELVMPPLIEFLDSLLTGTGEDLELQTFKLTDQISGRMLGLRADTTPQVARIDAHNLKRDVPTRLCYLGTVLHTRPEVTGGTRSPLQVGAELYGHNGIASDVEVLCLMLESLRVAAVDSIHIDVGHVGIYESVLEMAGLDAGQEQQLFAVLQRKAASELDKYISQWSLKPAVAGKLEFLVTAHGDVGVLDEARTALAGGSKKIAACIDDLKHVAEEVERRVPGAPLNFDLAELRGYHYHTGPVFAAYVPGKGQGIAFGGRYNNIGSAFGRARPATGFSTDLKTLLATGSYEVPKKSAIFAPLSDGPSLPDAIKKYRDAGEIVITELPGQDGDPRGMGCDRKLELKNGKWVVSKL